MLSLNPSKSQHAPEPVPAADSSPPTPWHWSASSWGSHLYRCDPQELADQCHGVGGELSAAGTGSGARCDFKRLKLSISHSAVRVLANCFVDILYGDGVTLELAR